MKKQVFTVLLFSSLFLFFNPFSAFAQKIYIKSECGKYLTVENLSTSSGTPIVLDDFHGSLAQQWEVIPRSRANGEYLFYIQSAKSGKYLDVVWGGTADGTKVQLWDFTGGPAQEWMVNSAAGETIKNRHSLHTQVAPMKCLDKGGGPCTNGTRIMIWSDNNTSAQNWYFEEVVPTPPPAADPPIMAPAVKIERAQAVRKFNKQ